MSRRLAFLSLALPAALVLVVAFLPAVSCGGSAVAAKSAEAVPDANMVRTQIPDAYKWKLGPLFASDDAADKAVDKAKAGLEKASGCRGTLADGRELKRCLDLYFETRLVTQKLTLYSNLRFDSHKSEAKLQTRYEEALGLYKSFMRETSFFREEIMALEDSDLAAAYKKAKGLKHYKPYISELRRRRSRVLGAEAERVLALAGDNLWAEIDLNEIPSDFEKAFGGFLTDLQLPMVHDEEGKEVQLTFSSYGRFRGSKKREVRRETVEKFFGALHDWRHALAALFSGQVNLNIFYARSRGYDTAIDAYLDKDNIDPAAVHNLIDTIRANLQPLHDYVALRKKAMGLDEIHIYDLYAPLVPGVDQEVGYEEAMEILPKALAPLGKGYVRVLEKGLDLDNGWVDVYPHKHKKSGAFCASVFGVHPFIKMNYFAEVDDLSTLAHEFGHAIHSHLAMDKQPYFSSNYTTVVAETASTTNEKFLSDYLLANAKSDKERLSLLAGLVETLRTTIYRQTLFTEFELRAHTAAEEGTPLTAELLNATYRELIKDYYGPHFTIGEHDAIEWAYVPHFYYKYYMYSYALGLASGIALADHVQQKGTPAAKAYLDMLRAGSSKPTVDLMKAAGVDPTKPEAVEVAAKLLAKSVAEMEGLLAKAR